MHFPLLAAVAWPSAASRVAHLLLSQSHRCAIRVAMDLDAIIGCTVIICALGLIVGLLLWSRRVIKRIAGKGAASSARQIMKDLRGER